VGGNAWRRSREGEGRKRHRQAWVSGGYGFTFNDKGIGFFLSGFGSLWHLHGVQLREKDFVSARTGWVTGNQGELSEWASASTTPAIIMLAAAIMETLQSECLARVRKRSFPHCSATKSTLHFRPRIGNRISRELELELKLNEIDRPFISSDHLEYTRVTSLHSQDRTHHQQQDAHRPCAYFGQLCTHQIRIRAPHTKQKTGHQNLTEPQLPQVFEPPAIAVLHLGQVLCIFADS
jgi:hypothetical protein